MGAEDLAHRWRQMVEAREAQAHRLRPGAGGAGFWDRRAEGFARVARTFQQDRLLDLLVQQVTPGTTVLDVGAGPGRYTLPLARAGAQVIAVEPSQGMRSFLEQAVVEEDLAVTVVPASWEEAEVPPCDVALCSHVVYGVRDILPFLQKLDAHARRACFLAIRVSQFDAYVRPLWEQIFDEPRAPEPTFIDLYTLLYAMGIAANVEIVPFGGRRGVGPGGGFADLEEA
ncbi:MAG: class I SAM-dependent methyltransferase, partial [Chloroflexi bacterium]|nr:class I SAM-dependent methyltransferase [Chloroflexota bacterium]